MSEDKKPSAESVAAFVADALRDNPEAEKEFRADPKKFLEEQSGKEIPKSVKVEVQENSDKTWHIPLGGESGPLDEVKLNDISGGWGDRPWQDKPSKPKPSYRPFGKK